MGNAILARTVGVSPARKSAIRLCFTAKGARTFMGERARGLARHFSGRIETSFHFVDTVGIQGWIRCFRTLVSAARGQYILWLISQHPARLLAAWLARFLFGTRFVVDTGDLLYESAKVAGKNPLACYFIRIWEAISIRLPDAIIVRGNFHKWLLEQQIRKPIVFIPDGVDTSLVKRHIDWELRKRLGLSSYITVGIMSTIGWEGRLRIPSPGWDLVGCLKRLERPDIRGVVIGDGLGLKALQALCEKEGLADMVAFVGRVPYEELPRYLGVIDICLHTALNNKMGMVRTTGKLPVMLACGCCIVASAVGEARRVLANTEMLLPFEGSLEEYVDLLVERVQELLEKKDFAYYQQIGPKIAHEEFDYRLLASRAENLLKDLAGS